MKSILRKTVDPSRISHRDTISYMGILLDDNNRKPICRLYFNGEKRKYVALMDENKKENKVPIEGLNDIYRLAEKLEETVSYYESNGNGATSE